MSAHMRCTPLGHTCSWPARQKRGYHYPIVKRS